MVHENQGYFLYCEQLQYHYTGMELFGCVLVFIAFMLAQFSVKVLWANIHEYIIVIIPIYASYIKFTLNYSRNSIWIDNSTMNLKIDPCSHNITQLTRQKGIKSLWQSSEQLLSCQCSLIVAIPAVHSACRYLKVSHRIHSYRGNCCTVWMWYILLNELLLQQSSAILNGRYQCVAFAYLLITPIF